MGTVTKTHLQESDHSIPGQKYPGNYRCLNFSIVLDDEGVVDTVGIDLPQGSEIPFQQGEQVTVKYRRFEGPYNTFEIIEIRTEDGKVFSGDFVYG